MGGTKKQAPERFAFAVVIGPSETGLAIAIAVWLV
jgi:hypothetical protein